MPDMALAFLFIQNLATNPTMFFMWVIAVIVSIVLHELGHGAAALSQGDSTPRDRGHMTLDPVVHMGTTSLIFLVVAGISWGLMPVNPRNYRNRYSAAFVAFAGPLVNILLAVFCAGVLATWHRVGGVATTGIAGNGQAFLHLMVMLNLVLALFNMLPIPPLDGATVAADLAPPFKEFARRPENQPFFMGAFILVFILGGDYLFPAAASGAWWLIDLFGGAAA